MGLADRAVINFPKEKQFLLYMGVIVFEKRGIEESLLKIAIDAKSTGCLASLSSSNISLNLVEVTRCRDHNTFWETTIPKVFDQNV